ncbi:MAG: hypothetical protein FWC40_06810 [Proteobacteria bacterium]|nr:hypothetical protein [Pseudomonadota bacterium]
MKHQTPRHTTVILLLLIMLSACSPKNTDELIPIEDIPISTPPEYMPQPRPDARYDSDDTWRVAPERIFNAPVPLGAEDLGCNELGCRIATTMSEQDVRNFLEKYFPYQIIVHYPPVNLFHVLPTIRPEYEDGGIFPTLNPNITRPLPGMEIDVRVSWIPSRARFEWQYRDPNFVEPSFEIQEQNRVEENFERPPRGRRPDDENPGRPPRDRQYGNAPPERQPSDRQPMPPLHE